MLYDVIEVRAIRDHILFLRFENGVQGQIDLAHEIPFKGVFAKLAEPSDFSTVAINKELGTIVWENGADLSPQYLYSLISPQVT